MTQSFELLSCERVEMKYSRFFENFQHFSFDHIGKKKKEEGRVLGAERLDEQVAHLSIWYFKNFNANWSQIRMRNWNHIWCAKCCRFVLPHKLRSNQVEKFYIRFYAPKAPIFKQARLRGDFGYWKMKFLFKTVLPGRQRSRGFVRGVVMVNIFLQLWRGDIRLEGN